MNNCNFPHSTSYPLGMQNNHKMTFLETSLYEYPLDLVNSYSIDFLLKNFYGCPLDMLNNHKISGLRRIIFVGVSFILLPVESYMRCL